MKAITLWNPWAFLIWLAGHQDQEVAKLGKHIETRSWYTAYRGPLAIHSAKHIPLVAKEICLTKPFQDAFAAVGINYNGDTQLSRILPCGVVMAVTNMVDCQLITQGVECSIPPEPERSFGDYRPGRFMWDLRDIKQMPEPIPVKGRQGLWICEMPECDQIL